MLINLSELFTCEGKKKVYDAEIGLTEVSIGGRGLQSCVRRAFSADSDKHRRQEVFPGGQHEGDCRDSMLQMSGTGSLCL